MLQRRWPLRLNRRHLLYCPCISSAQANHVRMPSKCSPNYPPSPLPRVWGLCRWQYITRSHIRGAHASM